MLACFGSLSTFELRLTLLTALADRERLVAIAIRCPLAEAPSARRRAYTASGLETTKAPSAPTERLRLAGGEGSQPLDTAAAVRMSGVLFRIVLPAKRKTLVGEAKPAVTCRQAPRPSETARLGQELAPGLAAEKPRPQRLRLVAGSS
jgi:hypothetical protein